ncbi:hypothetical protein FOZ60_007051, partial [Perkinsus olseni]
ALIKRHNVKMMNEMQEVVRQIMTAKTRNEEILLAYNTRLGEITRALTDLAEKQSSSKEVDDVKRQINQLRQLLNIRCGQTTEQVAQLKQSVIITLQRERTEMQQRISQLMRNDLTMVIHQCDRRLKEGHAQTLALKKVLRQLCNIIDGGETLVTELPDDEGPSPALEASKILNDNPRLTTGGGGNASGLTAAGFPRQQPQQQAQQQTISPSVQGFNRPQASATTPATPTSNNNTTPIATNAASGSAAQQAALTKRIAELIKRQSGNVSSQPAIAQLLAHLPQQQQQQLQQLLQQQQQKSYGAGTTTQQQSVMRAMNASAAAQQQQQRQQQQQQQRSFWSICSVTDIRGEPLGRALSLYFDLRMVQIRRQLPVLFIHVTNNREPLRHLPPAMIAQLQQQHSAQVLSGQITSSAELMQAIANTGVAKQAQQTQPGATSSTSQSTFQADTTASVSSSSSSSSSATQQDLIAAQIAHQQEGVSMGPKAKTIPCKFNSAGKCAYGSRCAYNHGGELPVGAATGSGGGRPANQPTAAAILAAMAKETRVQQSASLLSVPQQQQAGRQTGGPASTSVNRSSSEGRRPVGLSSKEGRSLVGSDVVTAAWLKDHLPELDFARNGQPPAPSGGDTEVVTATAAAAPPTSPPSAGGSERGWRGKLSRRQSSMSQETNGESSNTVDFGEVVVEEPVNTKIEEGGIESAGPPPGKLQAYLRLKMVFHESGLGFAPKTESG